MCPGMSWGILGCPGVIRLTHGNQKINTVASSEGQDEMSDYAAFHQCPHCLLSRDRNTVS